MPMVSVNARSVIGFPFSNKNAVIKCCFTADVDVVSVVARHLTAACILPRRQSSKVELVTKCHDAMASCDHLVYWDAQGNLSEVKQSGRKKNLLATYSG